LVRIQYDAIDAQNDRKAKAMEIKPIKTRRDYQRALKEIAQRHRRRAARCLLGDGVRRGELQAVGAVAIETRCRQSIVGRDARQRLAGGEAAINFGALEMLTGMARSHAPD